MWYTKFEVSKLEKKYIYIYNSEQAKFYINECGLKILDLGTGNKGDAFIKFENNDDYKIAFDKWCNR